MQEQIIRIVSPSGNGAHVFAPKEWIGEEVVLIRQIKSSLNEKIFGAIEPYLENVIGVYLYGSQARGEAKEDSDIDLVVITNKKIKLRKKGFEINFIEESSLTESIRAFPVLIYSALAEAKPIINSELLLKLKEKYKPKLEDFKDYLAETKRVIDINEELLDPYSLILRLKGLFIINILLKGQTYSNKNFKSWVLENVSDIDYNSIYEAYRIFKNKSKIKKVNSDDLRKLLELLKKETFNLEEKLNEKREKTAKRH